MSVETPEPLSDELARLLPHLDERVGRLVRHHRGRLEQRFAEQLLELLCTARDGSEAGPRRETWESAIRLVQGLAGPSLNHASEESL